MKTLLFVPAFNCEKQIQRVFARFNSSNLSSVNEILVIDNCSTDGTFETLQRIQSSFSLTKLQILQNPKNLGFGGSHKVAFQYCLDHGYDHCVVVHGDDQSRLDDFIPFLKALSPQTGFVFGSRFSWKSQTFGYERKRIWGNWFFNTLASLMYLRVIPDIGGSGLNIYNVKQLTARHDDVFKTLPDDLTFHVKLLFFLLNHNIAVQFVPIRWYETDQLSNLRLVRHSISLLKLFWANLFAINIQTPLQTQNVQTPLIKIK